jgi:hypothetical protein
MANMPNNPNYANNVVAYPGNADTSNVESLSAGGAGCWFPDPPTVTANGHPIASRADGALYDTTSGVYVSIQNTSVGTTSTPKNGQ